MNPGSSCSPFFYAIVFHCRHAAAPGAPMLRPSIAAELPPYRKGKSVLRKTSPKGRENTERGAQQDENGSESHEQVSEVRVSDPAKIGLIHLIRNGKYGWICPGAVRTLKTEGSDPVPQGQPAAVRYGTDNGGA